MISLILLPSSSVWVIWIITNWLTPGINYQLSVKKYLSPTGSALLSFLPWNNHFTVIQTRCTPAVVLVRVSTLLSFVLWVSGRKKEWKKEYTWRFISCVHLNVDIMSSTGKHVRQFYHAQRMRETKYIHFYGGPKNKLKEVCAGGGKMSIICGDIPLPQTVVKTRRNTQTCPPESRKLNINRTTCARSHDTFLNNVQKVLRDCTFCSHTEDSWRWQSVFSFMFTVLNFWYVQVEAL